METLTEGKVMTNNKKTTNKSKPKIKAAPQKPEKNKLPKHYGKKKIEADIASQGHPATEVQKAMLALNRMRNMYSKLKNRGISDMLGDTDNLSKEDARTIVAVVNTLEKKLNPILNKK